MRKQKEILRLLPEESQPFLSLPSHFDQFWDGLDVPIVESKSIKYADAI
jgi:hypothetical protein